MTATRTRAGPGQHLLEALAALLARFPDHQVPDRDVGAVLDEVGAILRRTRGQVRRAAAEQTDRLNAATAAGGPTPTAAAISAATRTDPDRAVHQQVTRTAPADHARDPKGDRPMPTADKPPHTSGPPPLDLPPPPWQRNGRPAGHLGLPADYRPPPPAPLPAAPPTPYRPAGPAQTWPPAPPASRRRGPARTIGIVVAVVVMLLLAIGLAARADGGRQRNTLDIPATVPSPVDPAVSAAPSPTPPPIPAQTYTGTGDDVVDLTAPVSAGVLLFDCPRCSRNTIVQGAGDSFGDLWVNEVGSYTGKRLIVDEVTRVEVTATGSWTLTVGGLDLARLVEGPVQGSGDDVLIYPASPDTAALVHDGTRNFVVKAVTDTGWPDLLVNEIGSYTGTVAFPDAGSPVLIEVTADGAWSVTPA